MKPLLSIVLVIAAALTLVPSAAAQESEPQTAPQKVKIQGSVLLPDGSPLKNKYVFVCFRMKPTESYYGPTTRTNEEGIYSVNLPVGASLILFVPKTFGNNGAVKVLDDGIASPFVFTTVTEAPAEGQYDIHLQNGTKVSGTVRCKNGEPAPNCRLKIEPKNVEDRMDDPLSVYTDTQGHYECWLAPKTENSIIPYDTRKTKEYQTFTTLSPDEAQQPLDFTIPDVTKFQVLLPDGSPTAAVEIYLDSYQEGTLTQTVRLRPDAHGNIRQTLQPGHRFHFISAKTLDGRFGINRFFTGTSFPEPIVLTLQPPMEVKVRLVDKAAQEPLRNFKFCYAACKKIDIREYDLPFGIDIAKRSECADPMASLGGFTVGEAVTDGDGVAVMQWFPEGAYHVYDGFHKDGVPELFSNVFLSTDKKTGEADLGTLAVGGMPQ